MVATSPQLDDEGLIGTSPTVTRIFEELLDDVHEGVLQPGERINDGELAARFGVSRTPVREALQRLREIGVVEASASRFTRIAMVTPLQTLQAYTVWRALFGALADEVLPRATPESVDAMRSDHDEFVTGLTTADNLRAAKANFHFFDRLQRQSDNPALRRALTSVVHIVRLGSLHLPDAIDLSAVAAAQQLLIEAADRRDAAVGREAMRMLAGIRVPQE
ncbi:MAG TPA: GntR family transcriptional regulator [Rhodoglobus sp.]|nr:GntR family transcriptional regulator [Rhodoglobus sp.]